jgi:hypothetical protein
VRQVAGSHVTVEVLSRETGAPLGHAAVTVTPPVYTTPELTVPVAALTSGGDGALRFYAAPGVYTFSTAAPADIEQVEVLGQEEGTGIIDGGAP